MEETEPKKSYFTCTELREEARKALSGNWKIAVPMFIVFLILTTIITVFINAIIAGMLEGLPTQYMFRTIVICVVEFIASVIPLTLSAGLTISYMKIRNGETVSVVDFIKLGMGKGHFVRNIQISLWIILKLIIPIILTFVSMVILSMGFLSSLFLGILSSEGAVEVLNALGNGFTQIMGISLLVLIIGAVWTTVAGLKYVIAYNIAYDEPELSPSEVVKKSSKIMKGKRGSYFILMLSFIGWSLLVPYTMGIGVFWLVPYMLETHACFYYRVKDKI